MKDSGGAFHVMRRPQRSSAGVTIFVSPGPTIRNHNDQAPKTPSASTWDTPWAGVDIFDAEQSRKAGETWLEHRISNTDDEGRSQHAP